GDDCHPEVDRAEPRFADGGDDPSPPGDHRRDRSVDGRKGDPAGGGREGGGGNRPRPLAKFRNAAAGESLDRRGLPSDGGRRRRDQRNRGRSFGPQKEKGATDPDPASGRNGAAARDAG